MGTPTNEITALKRFAAFRWGKDLVCEKCGWHEVYKHHSHYDCGICYSQSAIEADKYHLQRLIASPNPKRYLQENAPTNPQIL